MVMEHYDFIIGMLRITRWQLKLLDATGRNFDPLESQAHTIHIRSQLLC